MKVSIGIPFYNPGHVFKSTIESVLAQTFTDFELILLNDGSKDESVEIANSFEDSRVRVVNDGTNKGLPARLNELIALSNGEYIARMDADDLISPERLAKQVAYLDEHADIDLVSTGLCSITNDCKVIGYRTPAERTNPEITVKQAIFGQSDIAHATIMARKAWFERNRYNEKAKLMEDYQLWIDAAVKNDLNAGFISTPLYFYREESSVSPQKAINAYRNQIAIVKQQYSRYLSTKDNLHFTLLMRAKMAFVYVLNLVNLSNYLLAVRNKSTEQETEKLSELQQQLDSIRS
ncbi:glycosyltransferase family 2 protein [Thalassotalea euphylliae]|uniref:glycosyltransferase family 2 protein n=1 Tax=Thalassotalea euphylliae TaxID=1655234 RepID=UPI00362FDD6A